ncbi:hypothetical protein BJ878DRAFT_418765 [Calycina marina]|uniref:Uncharacterized protein n=1 Tax=Calycina marina TaxID=1763456 RepID=A0A9P7Z5S3_9HELO|nr:hypothetical protein BJ878DRAFT_418765 [Calycina marina]
MAQFEDFDDQEVYNKSQLLALTDATRNFVIEFGKEEAHIAFNLDDGDVKALLEKVPEVEKPVRWINVWSPNKQTKLVDALAERYKFSPRLLAVIKTAPPPPKQHNDDNHTGHHRPGTAQKDDVEANSSLRSSQLSSSSYAAMSTGHYDIAKLMINYHSVDIGTRFLCIGANWMHELSPSTLDDSIIEEGKQQPLWSWLILCDDNTVISLHEDPGVLMDPLHLRSIRNNTFSVMSQLSNHGHFTADPISIQSVRQAVDSNTLPGLPGVERASNLFYYLFDDWRAVFFTMSAFRKRLEALQTEILDDMTRRSYKAPNISIIPRLHILGRRVRQMQHLFEGYKNLTLRILESSSSTVRGGSNLTTGLSTSSRNVILAQSASTRFERLGDRLTLLILSETEEFLAEKDALINTASFSTFYFNINAQKDSEATARLTRSATLLAKLSVLFLPVSLMTAYFSVQIPELNNYTSRDYWYTFAVIISLSILALFFFSRLLMYITETLDSGVKSTGKYLSGALSHVKRKTAKKIGKEQ